MDATTSIQHVWKVLVSRGLPLATHQNSVDKRHDLEARSGMLHETVQVANYSAVTHLAVSVVLGVVFWNHASNAYLLSLNIVMFVLIATIRCHDLFKTSVSEAIVQRGILLSKIVALLIGWCGRRCRPF